MFALLAPALQAARHAAHDISRRMECDNNLKQIAMAMHSYAQRYKCIPPAFVPDKNGKPMHSWRVLLLPYLGEDSLYREYRFDEPWNSPHNKALAARMPQVYRCPGNPREEGTLTSYAMLVGPHAISDGPTGRSINAVRDGLTNTIMLVEAVDSGIAWLEPRDVRAEGLRFHIRSAREIERHAADNEISSGHTGGANVAFADGSVQFLSAATDPKVLRAMATIDGREPVERPTPY
jgi:prepilin-type processing-associated H-X9-DG protein